MVHIYKADSVDGFIQQLAVSYVSRGYLFYITGHVPVRKIPEVVDKKLLCQYGIDISPSQRYRRKKAGLASVQYLRHERFFVILATHGQSKFFEMEANIQDIRRTPLKYGGYSVSYRFSTATKRCHASVRIERVEFNQLKAFFLERAKTQTAEEVAELLGAIPYAPYAPVRRQLSGMLRMLNQARRVAGRPAVEASSDLFRKRRSVSLRSRPDVRMVRPE